MTSWLWRLSRLLEDVIAATIGVLIVLLSPFGLIWLGLVLNDYLKAVK